MLDLWPCNQSARGWAWLVYALWEGGVGQPVGLRPTKDHKVFPMCQEKLWRLRKDVWKLSDPVSAKGTLKSLEYWERILDSVKLPFTRHIIVKAKKRGLQNVDEDWDRDRNNCLEFTSWLELFGSSSSESSSPLESWPDLASGEDIFRLLPSKPSNMSQRRNPQLSLCQACTCSPHSTLTPTNIDLIQTFYIICKLKLLHRVWPCCTKGYVE